LSRCQWEWKDALHDPVEETDGLGASRQLGECDSLLNNPSKFDCSNLTGMVAEEAIGLEVEGSLTNGIVVV